MSSQDSGEDNFLEGWNIYPIEELLDISRLIMPTAEEVTALLDSHDAGTLEFDIYVWTRIWMYYGELMQQPLTPFTSTLVNRMGSIFRHR